MILRDIKLGINCCERVKLNESQIICSFVCLRDPDRIPLDVAYRACNDHGFRAAARSAAAGAAAGGGGASATGTASLAGGTRRGVWKTDADIRGAPEGNGGVAGRFVFVEEFL